MQRDCVKCGHVNANAAGGSTEACPSCGVIYSKALPPGLPGGAVRRSNSTPAWLVLLVLAATLVVAAAVGDHISRREARKPVVKPPPTLAELHISDSIQKYEMAARTRDRREMCVQAMIVAATHLTHKHEPGYRHWLAVEGEHCR